MKKFNKNSIVTTLVASLVIGLSGPMAAFAATTPSLGDADTFGVLGGTYTNTVVGTTINGDAGWTTPPAVIPAGGPFTGAGALTATARTDAGSALTTLNANLCTETLGVIVDLSTVTGHTTGVYTPGVYCSTGAMSIGTGGITLTGAGTYIFRAVGALTSVDNSTVTLANGASSCDAFWTPTAATTLGANTTFKGTIIDNANAITAGAGTAWIGRALSLGAGTVTTDTNTITRACTTAALTAATGGSSYYPIQPNLPQLTVIKHVINDDGGTAVASNFSLSVKIYGNDVGSSPAPGEESGRVYLLTQTGTTTVSEVPVVGYTSSFSGDCNSNGEVHMEYNKKKTCTITNNDIPLFPPLINVTKIPTPLALPAGAGSITYNYTVLNLGTVAMSNVKVTDDKCSSVSFVSGDTNGNVKLDITETWKYRCVTTLSQTTTNAVVATGEANNFTATDTAEATVVVGAPIIPPLIHVIKKPSTFLLPAGGGPVTYAYSVTNPGIAPLSDVSITDDKCTGLPGRVVGHPGDLNKNNLLESNETWSFTCKTNLTKTTTNTGTAKGHASGFTVTDSSPATVVVLAPSVPNTGFAPLGMSFVWVWAIVIVAAISAIVFLKKRKN